MRLDRPSLGAGSPGTRSDDGAHVGSFFAGPPAVPEPAAICSIPAGHCLRWVRERRKATRRVFWPALVRASRCRTRLCGLEVSAARERSWMAVPSVRRGLASCVITRHPEHSTQATERSEAGPTRRGCRPSRWADSSECNLGEAGNHGLRPPRPEATHDDHCGPR